MKIFRKTSRQLRADKSGVTAVEFALIAPVFLVLLTAGFEVGLLFIREVVFESAVDKIAKQVYLGNVSASGTGGRLDAAGVKSEICKSVGGLLPDCSKHVTVELRTVTSYSNLPKTGAYCIDPSSKMSIPQLSFDSGDGSSIVFLRACATVPALLPVYGLADKAATLRGNYFQLVSDTAFMNEPF